MHNTVNELTGSDGGPLRMPAAILCAVLAVALLLAPSQVRCENSRTAGRKAPEDGRSVQSSGPRTSGDDPSGVRPGSEAAGQETLKDASGREMGNDSGKGLFRIPRVNSHITVDAVLDEPIWRKALVLVPAYEVTPGENIPAPVRTEALLAYDEANLYLAFRAYDPNPPDIRAHYSDRDQLWDDDWVAIFIDTFNDGRRDYGYICNPFGIQADVIESEEGGGEAWDAIWDSSGRITDDGYTVEMKIPFSTLSFQRTESDQVWGVDIVRSYPRSVRHHIGLFPRDRSNNCYMCQAEKLIGFAGVKPGRNLEIDPTVSGVLTQEREDETAGPFTERERTFDPGMTVRWGFTPNLTLSAAANPDFSQVEADAVQLDINTQFALYYDEKRPLFMEGSDFFNTRLQTVHTRTFADPDWGIKLSGKEGRNAIGLFTVQDDVTNLIFPGSQSSEETSLDMKTIGSVLRFRRDIRGSSNLGMIVTDREGDEYFNRMGGIDATLKMTPRDQVKLQFLGSRTSYPGGISGEFGQPADAFDGTAVDFYYLHGTRSLDWYAVYREVSPDFRADIGFMPQSDFRYAEAGWGYTWNNDPDHWYNMLNFGTGYEAEQDFDGDLLHRALSFWFNYRGPMQASIDVQGYGGTFGYQGNRFDLKGIHMDTGFWPSGSLELFMCTNIGEDIDYANTRKGTRMRFHPEIEYNIGRHLRLELGHTYERFEVDEGRLYTANASRLKMVYQINRRTFIRGIVQYLDYKRNTSLYMEEVDERNNYVFSQFLFSYKINPQTVLFLGYSDNYYGDREIDLVQTDRTFFVKVGYAWVL